MIEEPVYSFFENISAIERDHRIALKIPTLILIQAHQKSRCITPQKPSNGTEIVGRVRTIKGKNTKELDTTVICKRDDQKLEKTCG